MAERPQRFSGAFGVRIGTMAPVGAGHGGRVWGQIGRVVPVRYGREVVPVTTVLHDQAALPPPEPGPPRRKWHRRGAMIVPLALVVVAAVVTTVVVLTRGGSLVAGTAHPLAGP